MDEQGSVDSVGAPDKYTTGHLSMPWRKGEQLCKRVFSRLFLA